MSLWLEQCLEFPFPLLNNDVLVHDITIENVHSLRISPNKKKNQRNAIRVTLLSQGRKVKYKNIRQFPQWWSEETITTAVTLVAYS